MDKKALSERDICTKFITPAVTGAGWDLHAQIREEVSFTAGRIIVKGKKIARGEAKRADYVLYYKPIHIDEFTSEKEWWCKGTPAGRARRKENEFVWSVSIDDLKANGYNLDIKNPNAEAAKHGDPDELLAEYKDLLQSVAEARDALKNELAAALNSAGGSC